jgi:hypothetical protein
MVSFIRTITAKLNYNKENKEENNLNLEDTAPFTSMSLLIKFEKKINKK